MSTTEALNVLEISETYKAKLFVVDLMDPDGINLETFDKFAQEVGDSEKLPVLKFVVIDDKMFIFLTKKFCMQFFTLRL